MELYKKCHQNNNPKYPNRKYVKEHKEAINYGTKESDKDERKGTHVHHIVAKKAKRARSGRTKRRKITQKLEHIKSFLSAVNDVAPF